MSETTKTTAGKTILHLGGYMSGAAVIGVDEGPYEGTRAELNVRRIRTGHILKHAGLSNPVVKEIMRRGEGYGCGYGAGSKLYPLGAQDVDRLLAHEAEQVAAHAAARKAEDDAADQRDRRLADDGLCPKCHTWCYGACE